MSAKPYLDDPPGSGGALLEAVEAPPPRPEVDILLSGTEGGPRRRLTIHAPADTFSMIGELDFLTRRAVDQNPFFAPQFLVPAMPRLDDRRVRLLVIRDEAGARSRLRLLLPFTVERAGLFAGATVRAFAHPFGRLGTPLVDGDDPPGTLDALLQGLRSPELGLPDVLVLPEMRLGGPAERLVRALAERHGLRCVTGDRYERGELTREGPVPGLLLSGRRRRALARQTRILARLGEGPVRFEVAEEPDAVRLAFEEFLVLEAAGWKGRARSALVIDRYRSAFAREAVNLMAARGRATIYALRAGGQLAASLVAFRVGEEGALWKIAYEERFAKASPGLLLLAEASRRMLADPDLARVDSCAMPDSLLVNRLWRNRMGVGTLVLALRPEANARVETVARALGRRRRSENAARLMRLRLERLLGR